MSAKGTKPRVSGDKKKVTKKKTSAPEKASSKSGKREPKASKEKGKGPVLRGAAPWTAKHAAKHAAEARARASEPPKPGSARATLRRPDALEDIKAQVIELHRRSEKIKVLEKDVEKNFYAIGVLLGEIQSQNLFSAKHFASFEAYVERECKVGKLTAIKLAKIGTWLQPDAAQEFGLNLCLELVGFVESNKAISK